MPDTNVCRRESNKKQATKTDKGKDYLYLQESEIAKTRVLPSGMKDIKVRGE